MIDPLMWKPLNTAPVDGTPFVYGIRKEAGRYIADVSTYVVYLYPYIDGDGHGIVYIDGDSYDPCETAGYWAPLPGMLQGLSALDPRVVAFAHWLSALTRITDSYEDFPPATLDPREQDPAWAFTPREET